MYFGTYICINPGRMLFPLMLGVVMPEATPILESYIPILPQNLQGEFYRVAMY